MQIAPPRPKKQRLTVAIRQSFERIEIFLVSHGFLYSRLPRNKKIHSKEVEYDDDSSSAKGFE